MGARRGWGSLKGEKNEELQRREGGLEGNKGGSGKKGRGDLGTRNSTKLDPKKIYNLHFARN